MKRAFIFTACIVALGASRLVQGAEPANGSASVVAAAEKAGVAREPGDSKAAPPTLTPTADTAAEAIDAALASSDETPAYRPTVKFRRPVPKSKHSSILQLPGPTKDGEQETWNTYLSKYIAKASVLRGTVRQLMEEKKYADATDLILAALQNEQGQPWMYEVLGISMQLQGASPEEIERALLSGLDFSVNPTDLLHVAKYMARTMQGNKPIEQRALRLFQQAARLAPTHPEAYVEGLAVAQQLDDLAGMQWAVLGILNQAWSRENREVPKMAANVGQELYDRLRANPETEEQAQQFKQALDRARIHDCVVSVTWMGDADLDLAVEEPSGSICSFRTPRTTAGGVMLGDTTVSLDERNKGTNTETYVCPQGYAGTYKIKVRRVWGKTSIDRVVVEFVTHEGTPEEHRQRKTVRLSDDGEAVVAFQLDTGRRLEPLAEQQVANAVDKQLSIGRAILAQQLSGLGEGGKTGGFVRSRAQLAGALARNGVGYQPLIITLPSGTNYSAVAVVSADRRYVRATTTPFFSSIPTVNTFNYATGSSGTGSGGTTGGTTGGGTNPPAGVPQLPPVTDGLIVAIAPWFTWYSQAPPLGTPSANGGRVGLAQNGAPGQTANVFISDFDDDLLFPLFDFRPVMGSNSGPNGQAELQFNGTDQFLLSALPLPNNTGLDFFMLGRPAIPAAGSVVVVADSSDFSPQANGGFYIAVDRRPLTPPPLNTITGAFSAGVGQYTYFGLNSSYSTAAPIVLEAGYDGTPLRRYRVNALVTTTVNLYSTGTGNGPYAQAIIGGALINGPPGIGQMAVGMTNSGFFPGAHRVTVLLVYNRLLTNSEAQSVAAWLNQVGAVF